MLMIRLPTLLLRQPRWRRGLAGLLGLTVFALGLLAYAPEAHGALHEDAHPTGDTCAVELLAQGATTDFLSPARAAEPERECTAVLRLAATVPVPGTARLRPPACGPPQG